MTSFLLNGGQALYGERPQRAHPAHLLRPTFYDVGHLYVDLMQSPTKMRHSVIEQDAYVVSIEEPDRFAVQIAEETLLAVSIEELNTIKVTIEEIDLDATMEEC